MRQRGSRQVSDSFYTTGYPSLDLIAGVVRLAISDAKRGDPEAIDWLGEVFPSWSAYDQQGKRRRAIRRNKYV